MKRLPYNPAAMGRDPFNIKRLGYAHDISKSFRVQTRGLFEKCCDLENIPGIRVALFVAVDEGPIFIYNEHTAGRALSRPRRKRVFHYRPPSSHQVLESGTIPSVSGPPDPQMTEAATSLLNLGSSRGDRIERQGIATGPRSSEERQYQSRYSIASILNPID